MFFLKLDCGRDVSVGNFDCWRTYGSLLEGLPNSQLNERIIEQALTGREKSWGKRKAHLIAPNIDLRDAKHPQLPPVGLRVWLTCYEPVDPAFMGSELVVVWFEQECHHEPISKVVYRAIRSLAWDRLAADFDW